MELFGDAGATDTGPTSGMRSLYWTLALVSLVPLVIVPSMSSTKVAIAVILGWTALIWIAICFVRGQFHYLVLMWVALYPYCYYFFSYPPERSIFTIDRAFIVTLLIEMFVVSRQAVLVPVTRDVRISGYCWGLYLLVCFVSIASHPPSEVLSSYRLLVDGMVMPALFGLYAIRYFPLLKDLRRLHLCACILGLGLCISGLIELTMGVDLFPWNGSEPEFTQTHVRRADGPFELHVVLSVVSILVFFLVIYLRRLMGQRLSTWRLLLHRAGAAASFIAAMVPLNRGLIFALVPVAIIDSCSRQRLISRRTWASIFGLILLAAVAAKLLDPRLYDERVASPSNFYQRVAQHVETLRVVSEYPYFGVGFGLYHDVASRDPRYMASWKGIESMTVPHNVAMTVLSEEGIVGLIFYISAQAFFIRAMWRIRKLYPPGWLAFLYCLLVYVLIGLDFATVYFSDINLLYIFTLGIIYQFQIRVLGAEEFAVPTHPHENPSMQVLSESL
jgi:hypothetical protein